ncbi:MAG: hypothetical protein IIB15_03750 [Chloroflexi bacterium]|nr:hypothetical protein [Chloroflexota bacterium]
MRKWKRGLKWMTGASMLLVLMLVTTVAYGGGRFSGIDPIVYVDGDRINVWVEWPEEYTCELDGLIDFEIKHSKKSEVQFVSESIDDFTCGDGSFITIETQTDLRADKKLKTDEIRVKARARATGVFPLRVVIYQNDVLVGSCEGETFTKKTKGWGVDCRIHLSQ